MTSLTRENFKTEAEQAERPVLIDFYADWCGPCRTLSPIIDELADEYGASCKFCKVDVDEQEGLAQQFDIMSVPTLIYMQDGEVSQRISGLRSREEIIEILGLA